MPKIKTKELLDYLIHEQAMDYVFLLREKPTPHIDQILKSNIRRDSNFGTPVPAEQLFYIHQHQIDIPNYSNIKSLTLLQKNIYNKYNLLIINCPKSAKFLYSCQNVRGHVYGAGDDVRQAILQAINNLKKELNDARSY